MNTQKEMSEENSSIIGQMISEQRELCAQKSSEQIIIRILKLINDYSCKYQECSNIDNILQQVSEL
jgi:hypothetical protein